MDHYGGRRVLIVGINYAPEDCGIAPYTTAAAQYFAAAGDDVLILTGVPHYPHWSVPNGFRWRLRMEEHSAGARVRRLRHFVPANQSAWKRGLYEATFGLQVVTQQLPWRPNVVLTAVPSLLGAAAAARLAQHHGAPLGVWLQDLMSHAVVQSGIAGGGATARLAARLERWILVQAAGVAVINDSFASHVRSLGIPAERVHWVPNWSHVQPPQGDPKITRKRLGWSSDTIVALHSGNMGLKQGLENVVEAAQLARKRREPIHFVLMGDGNQREALESLSRGLSTLQFLPPVPSNEYADTLAAADLLVVNERVGVRDMSLPSKLTSYFLAGRPVVAAVHPQGATARELARSGAGHIVPGGQPERLLEAIMDIARNPILAKQLGGQGKAYSHYQLDERAALHRLGQFVEAMTSRELTKHPTGTD